MQHVQSLRHSAIAALAIIVSIFAFNHKAEAMKIQQVKSPGGIEAWLVEEHSVPLIAVKFSFKGGSVQDPNGLAGVANFVSVMLDEGAGDLSSAQFQERMEDLAVRMGFEDGRDSFYGNLETLSEHRDDAFDLLRLALTKPKFGKQALERMRGQLLAGIAFSERDPRSVAARTWSTMAFGSHPYARPAGGDTQSVGKITSKDLEAYRKRIFAQDTLKIVFVGDIDAKTAGELLDKTFGSLAATATLTKIAKTKPAMGPKQKIVKMKVPQSVAQFGMLGLSLDDDDFLAGYVLNQIVGSGGFSSILMEEVREKRGLAYSVYSYLQSFDNAAVFAGSVATKNESIIESMDVIKSVFKRMATAGPTAQELKNAKSYLTGSFALRFDTSSKIASQLQLFYAEDFGIDYVEKRNKMVQAITLADVKRVAARVLQDNLLVTIVGQPAPRKPKT